MDISMWNQIKNHGDAKFLWTASIKKVRPKKSASGFLLPLALLDQ